MQVSVQRYSFGPFDLLPESKEVLKSGYPVKLAPQPFQMLFLLVKRAGQLVTREELQAALWADGTNVEFDQGLNYCVRQIRLALGDDAREPVYIETVPKRGYRFIADVARPAPQSEIHPEPAAPDPPPVPASRRPWVLAGLTAAVLLAVGFTFWPETPLLPSDPRARQLFLQAEHLTATWETDKVQEATKLYDEVTKIEPDFAPAWAGWTNADVVLSGSGPTPEAAIVDAELHARKALELDETLAVAHAALGHSYWQQWKWGEADEEFQRALSGKGDRTTAYQLYGLYQAVLGRKEEAVAYTRRALDAEPTSGLFNYSLAQMYLQTGDFAAAIAAAQQTQKMDRAFPNAFQTLLRAHIQLGRLDLAEQSLNEQLRYFPNMTVGPWRAYLLAKQGRREEARTIYRELMYSKGKSARPTLGHAAALIAMGEPDAAIEALRTAVNAHVPSMQWIWTAPELKPLHADPRFSEIATKVRPRP